MKRRKPRLLTCPFCGKRPEIDLLGYYRKYIIVCRNEDCLVQPVTRLIYPRKDAIKAWNKRKNKWELELDLINDQCLLNHVSGDDSFYAKPIAKIDNGEGYWNSLRMGVFNNEHELLGSYLRNYHALFETFYPFKYLDSWYALYSKDYTATRIMSLPDCKDLCGESRNSFGFCPTQYYVPYDDENLKECENNATWPLGSFGFVAGCVWGDDTSWKIQFLDLRGLPKSFIRDDRFGYIEMPRSAKTLKECLNFELWDDDYPCVEISIAFSANINAKIKQDEQDNL